MLRTPTIHQEARFSPHFITLIMSLTWLIGLATFTWPLYIPASNNFLTASSAKILSLVVAAISISVVFIAINQRLFDSKIVALLGILVAVDCALRLAGAGAAGIEPMWFLLLLASYVFGSTFGFSMGALAIASSALLTGGIGPWLPFQMFAAAWIGSLAGFLGKMNIIKRSQRSEVMVLSVFGVIAAELFGLLMDLQLWPWLLSRDTQLSYVAGGAVIENIHRFLVFHLATSLSWNVPRAIITAVLILVTGRAILGSLRRAQSKLTLPAMVQAEL